MPGSAIESQLDQIFKCKKIIIEILGESMRELFYGSEVGMAFKV